MLAFLPFVRGEGLLEPQDRRGRAHAGGDLPSLAVYGSCARGDARENSDLDLLVWTENTTKAHRKRFSEAVTRFNLKAERSIQVRFLTFGEFLDMPPEFRRTYAKDPLTVFVQPGTQDFPEGVHLQVLAATVDEAVP